ncbi:MAG: cytochrome c biogenesis protein CcsA [Bacteroidales bacterium]|nr:cytochrome c biogenesis protein CcsA [Bacteroidales bacterium]
MKKFCKYTILVTFFAIILSMAYATFFTQKVADKTVYNTLWFSILWGILSAITLVVVAKRLLKKLPVLIFHISLVVILLGALLTKISSKEGILHLRESESTEFFMLKETMLKQNLGFEVKLDSFLIKNYQGTAMPQDFVSYVTVKEDVDSIKTSISMNNIFKKNGYRFYQTSFDEDYRGTILTVNYDPYGTPLTYFGYIIFALSGLWILISKSAGFRKLLQHPSLKKGGLFVILICLGTIVNAQNKKIPTISFDESDKISTKQIVYNGRIAPFNTMARDFVSKIYGKPSYHNLTAEQVVCGWLYRPEVWKDEKMILIKDKALQKQLGVEKYASFADFFDENENYRLNNFELTKAVRETDEKIGLILMLTSGKLYEESTVKISESKVKAEIVYNKINFAKILFMVNLTIGFLAFFVMIFAKDVKEKFWKVLRILLILSLVIDFCGYCLRWYVSDRIPIGNGYETMLFMSLIIMLLAVIFGKKIKVLTPFGFLISGFTLLVAWLGQRNPQITPLMPVLNSPILSAHVSTIMIAYSLLSFTFFNGIFSLFIKNDEKVDQLAVLSKIMLYPAEILLGIGIFLGAVWANISWGRYWSWDPKETWALITFMIYAVGFHRVDLKFLQNNRKLHIFFVIAFSTVLMTYFGVNYFLGGMHSYAG